MPHSFEAKTTADDTQMKADSAKSSDEKFVEMLDRYYTKLDKDGDNVEKQDEKSCNQNNHNPIQYYSDKSSTYYRESKIRLKDEMNNFKSKMSDSITDYKSHYSDWRSND